MEKFENEYDLAEEVALPLEKDPSDEELRKMELGSDQLIDELGEQDAEASDRLAREEPETFEQHDDSEARLNLENSNIPMINNQLVMMKPGSTYLVVR